jgi:hypothetical protein
MTRDNILLSGLIGLKLQLECLWCIAVCRGVWPRRGGEWEGVVVGVRAHHRGESSTAAGQRGWLVKSGLWVAGGGGGRRYVGLDVLD